MTKLDDLLRGLKHLIPLDDVPSVELLGPSIFDGQLSGGRRPKLFLGTYDRDQVVDAYERYGVFSKLREKGFGSFRVSLDLSSEDLHSLRVTGVHPEHRGDGEGPGEPVLLGEVALRVGRFRLREESRVVVPDRPFALLCVVWLLLQNPVRPFTPGRPALPGQHHPGLKISREVMAMLKAIAARLSLDGITNSPEFAHNALLYSVAGAFRFMDPEVEGLLTAIRRTLRHSTLAEGAWACHLGCIKHVKTDEPVRWPHEEQMVPLAEELKEWFASPKYLSAVEETAEGLELYLDEERYDSLVPIAPDGSPRLEA